MTLLAIENLQTSLQSADGAALVVDRVSLSVERGQTLALVGESGCGKSMTAYSILRLVPSPSCRIVGGRILFNGSDLLESSEQEMQRIRGNRIAMVFQEPLTSLNPVFRIGDQVAEVLQVHRRMRRRDARERALQLLCEVGIPEPQQRLREYPHQLSGGMRQRVIIAMALACSPELIIADEPTTALDVTVQAQIMNLLEHLREKNSMGLLLITHDLGVVAEAADSVAVMYAGRIMEYAGVRELFADPLSPYTRGLLDSLPHFGRDRLRPINGIVPSLFNLPAGCKFSTRCAHVMDTCRKLEPGLQSAGEGNHRVRCWLYQ